MRGVELLNQVAAGWADWAVAGVIEAGILLGIVALVLLASGRRLPAAAAHVALLLVLVKAVLPIGIPVPRPNLSAWFVQARTHSVSIGERETATSASATSEAQADAIKPIATTDVAAEAMSPTTVADNGIALTTTPAVNTSRLTWQSFVMLAWFGATASLIVRLVLLQWWLRHALGRSIRSATDPLETLVRELAARLGIRRGVNIVRGPGNISPAIAGCWCPMLIVPRGLETRLSREQLEWVLLHELAHVRRGDLLLLVITRAVECLAWFNPAVWLAGRWAEHYRECACDELALEYTSCGRAECGEAFLALLAGGVRRPSMEMAFLPHGILTKHRMRRLVDESFTRKVFGKRLSATFVVGVFVLTLLSLGDRRVSAEVSSELKPVKPKSDESATRSDSPPSLDEAQPLVDRIRKQQKMEIHSARMRVKVLHLSTAKQSPVQQGRELAERGIHQIESLLDRTDFSRPDCLRHLRDALVEGNLILDQPAYRTINLAWQRSKQRGLRHRITLDDEVVVTYDNQVAVEYVPRRREAFLQRFPRMTSDSGLGRLQYGLWQAGPTAFASVLRTDGRQPRTTAIERGRDGNIQMVVTCMPIQSTAGDAPGNLEFQHYSLQLTGDEQIVRLDTSDAFHSNPLRELDFQEYPGGIVFPRVRISQYFPHPMRLEDITVTIIDHAEFNVDIPDSEFRMAVPANTAVWDRRGELKLRAAEVATEDVLRLFER